MLGKRAQGCEFSVRGFRLVALIAQHALGFTIEGVVVCVCARVTLLVAKVVGTDLHVSCTRQVQHVSFNVSVSTCHKFAGHTALAPYCVQRYYGRKWEGAADVPRCTS